MEDNSFEQPEKISLYNSGMAQIKRLDELWVKVHRYAEGGQLVKWNWALDRVWCELIGDLPELKENKEVDEDEEDNPINRFEEFNIRIGEVNKELIDKKIKVIDYHKKLYRLLMDKEAFLRRLQNKLGKGTKLVDADEDMIE